MQFGILKYSDALLLNMQLARVCKEANPGEPVILFDADCLYQERRGRQWMLASSVVQKCFPLCMY